MIRCSASCSPIDATIEPSVTLTDQAQPLRTVSLPVGLARRRFLLLGAALVCAVPLFGFAQEEGQTDQPDRSDDTRQAMSDAEIEQLREDAYLPPQRILTFISFLNRRTEAIGKLNTGPRHPGREEDVRDLMNQFSSIADDLDDNLDDYSKRQRDVRKVLPKLLSAIERWGTMLRTPPDDERYNVARKLALTALADVQESAQQLLTAQQTYFHDHPPAKGNGI